MVVPFVTTVSIQNFKSIARCRVSLGRLTLLVGPNGAGKSNFVDALRFVAEALGTTVEFALRERGGINSVRRQSRGHPTHFRIQLKLSLPDGPATYSFRIGSQRDGGFIVQHEECRIASRALEEAFFVVEEGHVKEASVEISSALEADRLALVTLSGLREFRGVYDALRRMSPGATEVIAEALGLASRSVQVIATTHSPDLLNHKGIRDDQILAVAAEHGGSIIGPLEPSARKALKDRLYGAGELLSQGQAKPDRKAAAEASGSLFSADVS